MKNRSLLLYLSPILVIFSDDVHAQPRKAATQDVVEYRVVGVTRPTVGRVEYEDESGGQWIGYGAMHKLCEVDVAPNARAAFSEDILRYNLERPPLPTSYWFIPSRTAAVPFQDPSDASSTLWAGVDEASGVAVGAGQFPLAGIWALSCDAHFSSSDQQTGVAFDGRAGFIASCNVPLPIACAAPVKIPVSP